MKGALLLMLALVGGPALAAPDNRLFAVKAGGRAEPVARLGPEGFNPFTLDNPAAGKPPRTLYFYARGRAAGKAKVASVNFSTGEPCSDGESLTVESVPDSVALPALATERPLALRPAGAVPALGPADVAAMSRLAGAWMARHKVGLKQRTPALETLQVHAVGEVLSASVNYSDGGDTALMLYFLADRGHRVVYEESYFGPPGEAMTSDRLYVGHLDLDGDGVDEIVVSWMGYEWWGHDILKREKGQWRKVYNFVGLGGC